MAVNDVAPVERIAGLVEAVNPKGVRVDGRWWNYSRYADVPRPARGQHVELDAKGGFIRTLRVVDVAPPDAKDRERTILRLAVLKAAAGFVRAASTPTRPTSWRSPSGGSGGSSVLPTGQGSRKEDPVWGRATSTTAYPQSRSDWSCSNFSLSSSSRRAVRTSAHSDKPAERRSSGIEALEGRLSIPRMAQHVETVVAARS
jgi:hypothetical protein